MAEMVITELRRHGSSNQATLTSFRWTSQTHSSMTNPLELKLKINTSRRMPIGASVPVEQVLSVEWEPFDVSGEWNDKWSGRGFAQKMKLEFAQMCARVPLVRFQIDEESIVGIITNLVMTYITRDRIAYNFRLSPHKNETAGDPRESLNQIPPQPINVRVDKAKEILEDLIDATDLVSDLPTQNFDIEDSIGSLDEVSDAVGRASAIVDAGINQDAERTLLTLATTFRRMRGAAQNVFNEMGRRREDLTLAFQDAISILKFREWSKDAIRQASVAIGVSRQAELDMRARASRQPRAVHIAKQGESLERIAVRYTGNADNWKSIYDASGLDSVVLEGGEELIVPERSS